MVLAVGFEQHRHTVLGSIISHWEFASCLVAFRVWASELPCHGVTERFSVIRASRPFAGVYVMKNHLEDSSSWQASAFGRTSGAERTEYYASP